MKTLHTPGPWTATESRKNEWMIIAPDLDLARILHNGRPHPDGKRGMHAAMAANARLIAAAPDLVEALKLFEDLCPRVSDDDPIAPALADAVKQARDALAKAEGK